MTVDRLTTLIDSVSRITYGGLFGGIRSEWSLADLQAIDDITRRDGIPLQTADKYVDSLWVDGDWGRPPAEVVAEWRGLPG